MRSLFICLVALALLPSVAQAQSPSYKIKEDIPRTGSMLKRDVVSLHVPPDRDYAQLTQTEQERVKSSWEAMAPGDEPPYPVGGPRKMLANISAAHAKVLIAGTFDLVAKIGPDGKVHSVDIFATPDPALTRVVAGIVMLQKFKPAMCSGKPCTMDYPLRMELKVEN